jgi:hypothetical protein
MENDLDRLLDLLEPLFALGEHPALIAIIGLAFLSSGLVQVMALRRRAVGIVHLLCGAIWVGGAAIEEYCKRWSEAHLGDVPIRVDLILIPPFLAVVACLGLVVWISATLALRAKQKKEGQRLEATPSISGNLKDLAQSRDNQQM